MIALPAISNRMAAFARRAAVLTIVASLTACADDASTTRPMEPSAGSFAKNGGGSGGGQRIIFTSNIDDATNFEVYSMNPDGTGITRLTNNSAFDASPVWSPDGKRVAFASDRYKPGAGADIFVMNADGTNVVRLTNGSGLNFFPSWSKDGKQIAFASTRAVAGSVDNDDLDIYVMNDDGTNVTRLTTTPGEDSKPAWSPDGRLIAFVSDRDHAGTDAIDLYVMNPDGSNVGRVTNQTGRVWSASWDPHSRRIAYSLYVGAPDGAIFTIMPDGSGLTHIAVDSFGSPSWSPDGSKFVYICYVSGGPQVCTVNSDGTGKTLLTSGNLEFEDVHWSR